MKATTWFPLATTLLFAAACGGSSADSTGSTTDGAGSGGGDEGTTSGAGAGIPVGDTLTLTMEKFTVPAGGEVYKCQNFKNPFGDDVEVSAFESHMTVGSHHLLLFYNDTTTDGPLEDCSGLEFAATPYSTQLSDDMVAFPKGIAAKVPAATGMRLQSHYLNSSATDLTATIEVTFHLADPTTITAHAGVFFVVEPKVYVAPNSTGVISKKCPVPLDMNLIKAVSHMHKHATKFESSIGGKSIFATETWDEPKPAFFDPALAVKAGDDLEFACTFVNNSAKPLVFGESAENNEMCIFAAAFYPVPDGEVTVGCK